MHCIMIWIVFLLCFGLIQCNVNQTEDKLVFAQVVSENYFVFPLDLIENVVLLLFVKFRRKLCKH